jgi:lipoyl(octanoyl) transferase
MAVDEAILEHAGRGDSPPTLRLYAWQPACLSLGYAQPYADVDESRLARPRLGSGAPPDRRTRHPAHRRIDLLCYHSSPGEPLMEGTVLESYNRIASCAGGGLPHLGLPVSMEQHTPPAEATKGAVCFEVPSAYEIVLDGKKLIGSAQARKREGILQHGSLPLHGDLTRIVQALAFEDEASAGKYGSPPAETRHDRRKSPGACHRLGNGGPGVRERVRAKAGTNLRAWRTFGGRKSPRGRPAPNKIRPS